MSGPTADEQRRVVRERYAGLVTEGADCCGSSDSDGDAADGPEVERLGYDREDSSVAGAESSLGCGNPTAIAALSAGETVLDLGSGGGFDCFLAADAVGESGRVIGVDMTPEMIERARENARQNGASNVEFRLGEIEHLPVADASVDAIISNCVINLSPKKPQVFAEAFRVLRPGGRLAVSDVVRTAPIPEGVLDDPEALAACVAGAATVEDLEAMLDAAGFVDTEIRPKDESREFIREWSDDHDVADFLVSAAVEARKPRE